MTERLESFTLQDMTPRVNDAPVVDQRYFGGDVKISGRYTSPTLFSDSSDAVNRLALNPAWGGNQAQNVATATIRPGTLTYVGTAAPQETAGGLLPGGAPQTFIPADQLPHVTFGDPQPMPAGHR
jgi:hypothetical protein